MLRFRNLHKGETCLLVGNGPSLNDTPIIGKYSSIGSNTIMKGYKPTYYVAVDERVMREYGDAADNLGVPIFVPQPDLDAWQGVYRFWHRPVPLWPSDFEDGIDYECVMHAQMQLAYYMGFTRMLCIGMDHTLASTQHFWGADEGMRGSPNALKMAEGYKELREGMGVEMLNLSPYTELDDYYIPRDDWKNW